MIKKDGPASRNKWNDRRKAAIDCFIMKATKTAINQDYTLSKNNQTGVNKHDPSRDDKGNKKLICSRKVLASLENNRGISSCHINRLKDMTISKSPKSISGKYASDKIKNISSMSNIKDTQANRRKRFLMAAKKNRAHTRLQICLTLKELENVKKEISIVLDKVKESK